MDRLQKPKTFCFQPAQTLTHVFEPELGNFPDARQDKAAQDAGAGRSLAREQGCALAGEKNDDQENCHESRQDAPPGIQAIACAIVLVYSFLWQRDRFIFGFHLESF